MSGLIRISGGATVNTPGGGGGSSSNTAPTIRNFRAESVSSTTITIKYIAEDAENAMLRSYIYINDSKKEITRDVKINEETHEYEYILTKLTKNTPYKLQVEVSDSLDTVRSDVINISTKDYIIYGVRINENNSNPDTCVEYIEDCIGFTPAKRENMNDWSDKFPYNKFRIVGLKNGIVTKEIDTKKTNYDKAYYKDGETVPNDVDIMVEVPKVYWCFTDTKDGYEIRISDTKVNENYVCLSHTVGTKEKDVIYIGVYLGIIENGKLRSICNKEPHKNNIDTFRESAHAVGKGYEIMYWFALVLYKILYIIFYKNLDSSRSFGIGYTSSYLDYTGKTNGRGLMYTSEDETSKGRIRFLGLEDFWGHLDCEIDGIKSTEVYTAEKGNHTYDLLLSLTNDNFNSDGLNYKRYKIKAIENENYISLEIGFYRKLTHDNFMPFLPNEKTKTGSDNIYYCDETAIFSNCLCLHGLYNSYNHFNRGIFNTRITLSKTEKYYGARLVYLGE